MLGAASGGESAPDAWGYVLNVLMRFASIGLFLITRYDF